MKDLVQVIKRDKPGLSELLLALRMNPSAKKKTPYERYTGKEPNTIKQIITNTDPKISESPELKLS